MGGRNALETVTHYTSRHELVAECVRISLSGLATDDWLMMPADSLGAGARLGPYEIVAAIGSGGMGVVYRATDARLGRDVAIKVLPPVYIRDPDRLRRFEHEARAAAALNHPNILAVYDIGIDDGRSYIVSELLDGQTLRAAIGEGPLHARKAVEYAVQIARGLAAAHDKGIVHRDLKPENVFITRDGRVKIIDFGLAKLIEAPQAALGATAFRPPRRRPTPASFWAPSDTWRPNRCAANPRARCDIFAVGTMLFEMLTGRRAFSAGSAPETMTAILRADPLELPEATRIGSPALQRIVQHCLEKILTNGSSRRAISRSIWRRCRRHQGRVCPQPR